MTTIDRLGGTASVNDDDLLVLYKRNNRRTRNVSAQDFAAFASDSAPVQSVNNKTGEVQLDTDDIPEGAANLYFTDARASAAAPVQSVNTQTGDVLLDAASVGADPAGTAASSMAAHVAAPDPHPQYLTETEADALYAKTASNLGAGAGVFASKVGTTLQFKSLVAGANITLTPSGNEIQISAASVDFLNTARIDVASAATVNLTSSAPNTRHINITGTTAITGFTVAAGQCYFVRFAGALTLTNSASLVTQTGANITTAAGDTCIIRATAANVVDVLCYTPSGGWINSFSANGYQKLPSGLIIQWGVSTATTVTFPVAFPIACLRIISEVTNVNATSSVAAQFFCVTSRSATGFTLASANASYALEWLAIGY